MPAFRGELYFLSNFYPIEILSKKWGAWPSAEHLYQACKFTNPTERELIRSHPSKGLKSFCRTLSSLRPNWNELRTEFMWRILVRKFALDKKELRGKLVATKSMNLVETNEWHDNYWGSCVCNKCNNSGSNTLGSMLMEMRHFVTNNPNLEIPEDWRS
jgi:ribA/ribD-fused uncharacterized protein